MNPNSTSDDLADIQLRPPSFNPVDASSELIAIQDDLLAAWSHGQWQSLSLVVAQDAVLTSNQHGVGTGFGSWRDLLARDASGLLWMQASNQAVVIGASGQAAASFYIYGLFGRGNQRLLFGATVVLSFTSDTPYNHWMLASVRINVNWCKGALPLVQHWRMPPSDTGWGLGDAPPVIVSELDSPWAQIDSPMPYPRAEEAVRQLYSKYSFAIDQGDIGLLSDCYTQDVSGGFTPLGHLRGRHAIVGQLKSFRRLWPWMQHFADVVRVEFEPDGLHAQMIVARIIPERSVDEVGRPLYGAHYQIRARREPDGQWRICWSDYRPGWFTAAQVPEFDIGVTDA